MAFVIDGSDNVASIKDPLLPWLRSAVEALTAVKKDKSCYPYLYKLVTQCVRTFKDNERYKNDVRFLKIWFIYMDGTQDFESVFKEMVESRICIGHSALYEWYAVFLEAKGRLEDANRIYRVGISRQAQPIERLKKAYEYFLQRMREIVDACSAKKMGKSGVNPWSASTMQDMLKKITTSMVKYNGYHSSAKPYNGKVSLTSLQNQPRNRTIEIGGKKYLIKGCAGKGGFAQVYKGHLDSYPDDIVAVKIQKPAFPWEFHMYRMLDQCISGNERTSFGFAHRIHIYADCSILICDYLDHGTLHDAINYYAVTGKHMDELLCIYYTIEMLYMLETLHGVGIIHGDFKPDNLLVRHARTNLTEDGFREHAGPWRDQGLCLVDWGRGIDLHLFPDDVEFEGDCRTSGFRCVQMQEKKTWKFQVDTYGLCVAVHMMLHNSYLEIVKKESPTGSYYRPKAPFKRYWNADLWESLFIKLLNSNPKDNDKELLRDLRVSFQDYMCSTPQHLKKLKDLLAKQRASLCST